MPTTTGNDLRQMQKDSLAANTRLIGHNELDHPTDPKLVGFHPVLGSGVHRMWFRDGNFAHVAAQVPGGHHRGYQIVDLSDPTDPSMAGGWSLPTDWPALDPKHDHMQVHG